MYNRPSVVRPGASAISIWNSLDRPAEARQRIKRTMKTIIMVIMYLADSVMYNFNSVISIWDTQWHTFAAPLATPIIRCLIYKYCYWVRPMYYYIYIIKFCFENILGWLVVLTVGSVFPFSLLSICRRVLRRPTVYRARGRPNRTATPAEKKRKKKKKATTTIINYNHSLHANRRENDSPASTSFPYREKHNPADNYYHCYYYY